MLKAFELFGTAIILLLLLFFPEILEEISHARHKRWLERREAKRIILGK